MVLGYIFQTVKAKLNIRISINKIHQRMVFKLSFDGFEVTFEVTLLDVWMQTSYPSNVAQTVCIYTDKNIYA